MSAVTATHITLDPRSAGPLRELAAALAAEPGRARLVLALVDIAPAPAADDPQQVTANVRHVAVVSDAADRRIGRLLLRREHERRAGRPVLPWALEIQLRDILHRITGPTREDGHP